MIRFGILATAFGLVSNVSTFAQEITGTIVGTVRDSAGASVPGATVTIKDSTKNGLVVRTLTTNEDGEFTAPGVQVSVYQITVEAKNFKKSVKNEIKIDLGQRRTIDVTLEAGRIDETVTVEADPVAVDLQSATSGTIISGNQVREIPINNRNFVQLVTLAPGVSNDLSDQVYTGTTAVGFENGSSSNTAQASQPNTIQISVNGARSSQNTFTVDGADVTDRGSNLTIQAYPSVDSIGEFRVLRSLFPAESGRSGGGQVNVLTRSGGSKFRGSGFGFVRNEIFNANDYFSNQIAPVGLTSEGRAKRKPFRYVNYGWTLGGQVVVPNFGERDSGDPLFRKLKKTFFFYSQELRRDRRSPTLFSLVPSAILRTGRFTVPICTSATGAVCNTFINAGDPLPSVNPISQQYLTNIYNKLPLPNTNSAFNLNYPTPNEANFRQEIIKIDHSFSDKWSMYYRFQSDTIPTLDANAIFSSGSGIPFVSTTKTNSPGKTHTAQTTYVASSNLIFEVRYNFGYGAILSENVGLVALKNSPIAPPLPYSNTRDRVPSLVFANGAFNNIGGFGPYDNFSYKGNLTGTVTWIAGSHQMKFGVVYSKYRKNENALAGVNEGQFSGFNTPGVGVTTAVIATGGTNQQQQFANFLLGSNVSFTQAKFDYTADLRQKAIEGFAQDEWRVRKNLTLYLGVRYSFFGSPWDKNGRLSNFVPELWNAASAPDVTGAGNRIVAAGKNFCNGIIVNSQNVQTLTNCTPTVSPWGKFVVDAPETDFAPRVGLAWDPFGKGTTSIRTGYGMYHEQTLNGVFLQNIGTNSPYQQTCTLNGVSISNPDPAGVCNNAAFGFGVAQSIRAVQSNWNTPYTQHWSLDFQQQLTKNTVATVGYYGSKGTHLIGSFEMNLLQPGAAIARGVACASGANYLGQTTPQTLVACQAANTAFTTGPASTILDQIRPYRGYRALTMVQPRYNSSYHSLQISAQHRFSGASQVNIAYTWAKNLTDNQNDRSASPQNTYDISLDKGRAALDRRHIFSANYIYEIPFFSKQQGFAGKILGGWQASGIVTFNTGLPLTPTTSSFDPAGLGIIAPPTTVARPNVTCNPNVGGAQSQQQWFNTSCFQANSVLGFTNTVGNSGRGIIDGPGTSRVDFTMSKNIRFSETLRLQLRAEVFNAFNKVNFRSVVTNVTSTLFGQAISTRDPRTMQFGAKFNF